NSARIVSIPPSTDMGPPSCSRRSRTYSIGSPLASVLFQGSSRGKVEEITCLCIGLIHCPNGSSDSGQYCDHSCQSRRPITVSVIGASDSAISSPSSAPKASNCQRWGFSTTPLAEWKRWAEVTRAMVVPFFRLGLSFDKTTLEPGTHRSRDDFSDRLVCPEVIGQPELAEYHCAHEVGDPCNSAAGDVEHVDRERRPLALTIREVHRGSRLPIRSSGDRSRAPTHFARAAPPLLDLLPALEPEFEGRHAELRVLRQQRDEPVDVIRFESGGVVHEQLFVIRIAMVGLISRSEERR